VYLAADSLRYADPELAALFRRRALLAGVLSGGLALAGLLVMRGSGLNLTRGAALALVCVSGAAGLATLALCWASRFGLARLTAALAVAAVVVGWAAAQTPRFLPGMTVTQAAAGNSTLVALVIAVGGGAAVLVPSLGLLYTLFLRGRLDTPESHAPGDRARYPAAATGEPLGESGSTRDVSDSTRGTGGGTRGAAGRWGTAAVAGLVAGAGLLVFTDAPWTHGLGVAGLLLCAVAVFALTATPLDR
jgi:cytochrome d ubiquinol oxidase subunit II